MPKVDFVIIVFNGMPLIEYNLQNIYPFANRIIIIEGPVKHYQTLGHKSSYDGTIEVIKNFPDPEKKIVLKQGLWQTKNHMIHAQEKYFNGEYIWEVDADEFYKPEDMEKIFGYLDKHPECFSMSFKLYSFYGGFERHISGFEENFEVHRIKKIIPGKSKWLTHRPPTMLWPPTGKKCKDMGHVDHKTTDSWGVRIYHYSFVFPAQVKAKTVYYRQRGGAGIIGNYWENLFVPWMRATTEKDKLLVEKPTLGVQVWTPNRRGPAFTKQFSGKHPEAIEKAIPELEKRIQEQGHNLGIWK